MTSYAEVCGFGFFFYADMKYMVYCWNRVPSLACCSDEMEENKRDKFLKFEMKGKLAKKILFLEFSFVCTLSLFSL